MRRSLDTETTGIDFFHGAMPFFVTTCDEEGNQQWWEWDVNPLTRKPIIPEEDVDELAELLSPNETSELVLQNPKFDVRALNTVRPEFGEYWRWDITHDTLMAGHLLASNQPHDLTTMTLQYLGVDIEPYEVAIVDACNKARAIARRSYPDWRIAKKGLPEMPSAKEKVAKFDMWLPRALVRESIFSLNFKLLPDHPQQPKVVRVRDQHTVRIDRKTKWGNPFVIGRDGTREDVIRKYARYIWNNPKLLADLPELYGQILGCHCSPEICHGDVLRVLCHPWRTVLREYANADSSATLPLFLRMKEILEQRGLWEIYLERIKLLPIVYQMESHGITINRARLEELRDEYREESARAGRICTNIAAGYGYELTLPKSGNNGSLTKFVFDVMKLPVVSTSKRTGKPGMDKNVIESYLSTLPERSKELTFVRNLSGKRKRDTALSYMEGYERFWNPTGISNDRGEQLWYRMYPSLNATGTDTLRWSSQSPNEQNISKKEGFNLRYMFGPAPGREWWSLDYDNLELRIPAYECGEPAMLKLFEEPDAPPYFGSYHLLIFDILHPDLFKQYGTEVKTKFKSTWYQWTKNGNFAELYGAVEASGTADRAFHVPGAQRIVADRLTEKSKLNQYWINYAKRCGYVETMPDIEVCPDRGYPLLCTRTKYGDILPTVPLNYHVQGTACWIMMRAMIKIQEYLDELNAPLDSPRYSMVMNVHDEVVLDFPYAPDQGNLPKIRKIQRIMESIGDCVGVRLTCGVDYHPNNWSESVSL